MGRQTHQRWRRPRTRRAGGSSPIAATRSSPTTWIATSITRTSATSIASSARLSHREGPRFLRHQPRGDGSEDRGNARAGGTQILMQGGHHPKLTKQWYLDLLSHIKAKFPQVNIHGFSPSEFIHFREVFSEPLERSSAISSRRVWVQSPAAAAKSSWTACASAFPRSRR